MNGNTNPNMVPQGNNMGTPNMPNNANNGGVKTPPLSAINNDQKQASLGQVQQRQQATPSGMRAEDYKRSSVSRGGGLSGKNTEDISSGSTSRTSDTSTSSRTENEAQKANRRRQVESVKMMAAREGVKKVLAAEGVPEPVTDKFLQTKAGQKALKNMMDGNHPMQPGAIKALKAANKAKDNLANRFKDKPDSEKTLEEKSDEEEERKLHSGDLSFSIPPKVIKWLVLIAPACIIILFFVVIVLGEIAEEKTSSMILGELSATEKKEIVEDLVGQGSGQTGTGLFTGKGTNDVAIEIDGKLFPNVYYERLGYLGNNYTSRAKCVDKEDCMSSSEFLYYLKVADLSIRYKKKYNITLDWSLIVATDLYLTKSTEDSMKDNLSDYDKDNVENTSKPSELDWDNDFKHMSGYIYLNANDSRYDLNILAKNMVKKKTTQTCTDSSGTVVKRQEDEDLEDSYINGTKRLNCDAGQSYFVTSTYTKDLDKFDDFMLEYIDHKMLTPGYGNGSDNCSVTGSDNFIWPIGSKETTVVNGKEFALGDPVSTTITSKFASQEGFRTSVHGGLDIGNSGHGAGVDNVIASKAGKVVYPTDKSQTMFPDAGYYGNPDGGGFGNFVVIEHSDNFYTLYGHLAKGSITVFAGEEVQQGQVIAKLGHSGSSTGPHLHFEVRNGGNNSASRVDPEKYVDPNNPRSGTSINCSQAASGMADAFVKLAVAQLQDPSASGGQKYWSFMGFNGRVAWCACFVSWNIWNTEYNGQKLSDIIDHKDAAVYGFMNWAYNSSNPNVSFKYNDNCSHYAGKNGNGTYTPKPGDLIFFDWSASWSGTMPTCFTCGPDHIGIVQKVEGGIITTIEGNSGDSVRENTFDLNSCKVIGFASWY